MLHCVQLYFCLFGVLGEIYHCFSAVVVLQSSICEIMGSDDLCAVFVHKYGLVGIVAEDTSLRLEGIHA